MPTTDGIVFSGVIVINFSDNDLVYCNLEQQCPKKYSLNYKYRNSKKPILELPPIHNIYSFSDFQHLVNFFQ